MNQKKVESGAEFVSHSNKHRLNLLLRDVTQGSHVKRMGRDVPGAGPGDAGELTAATGSSAAGAGVGEWPGSHGPWPPRWHGSARGPWAPQVCQGVGSFLAGLRSACPAPL